MDLFFVIWFILLIYIIAKNITQFIKNENSPQLTVPATIVDMRRRTHHHHTGNTHHHSHSYHITFGLSDGELLELRVKRYEYRELTIGEKGMLTYQGTRYKGFVR